ncbi:hypothetical protein PJP10_30780 [Mycobacterium kansasii]
MDDLLEMTLEFETTQLRPPSELYTLDDLMSLLSSFNEQSVHINSLPIDFQSVCAGLEQESVPPSTIKDNGFLGQIITSSNVENKSSLAELPNFLDDCLTHFADSNVLMLKDKVDALQDYISVVITN